ncbi:MAG TPA: hypothetical protein VNU95_05050 [Candidatus Acidoferrales bacterium]|nr:hypothetical protein [Candidatus Acidoferrales bacterium]
MKHSFTLSKLIPRPGLLGSALAALALLAIAASSSSAQVLPPSSLPYGLSYQEWSAKWWQSYYSQSADHLQPVTSPNICEGPASRVLFLAGAPQSTTTTNHVTIPAGSPLFFAILGFEADNTSCPTNTFTTNSADVLANEAVNGWDSAATETSCTIDGVAVPGLGSPTNTIYNVVSPPFSYTTAEKDNVAAVAEGEPCLPGGLTVYPTVADGVYLMLAPLPPGKHTIHFIGEAGPGGADLTINITYDITVLRDFSCGGF